MATDDAPGPLRPEWTLIRDPERLAIDGDSIALGDRTSGPNAPLDSSALPQ